MKFCEKLNEYIASISCTAKELCALSGISEATLSRYRSGERVPELGTKGFNGLCTGIAQIAESKAPNLTYEKIKDEFCSCSDFDSTDKELLRKNFNTLISALSININRMCRYINYDVSTVFRIRNGTRNPADFEGFSSAVASFIAEEMKSPSELTVLAELLGCSTNEITDQSAVYTTVKKWLVKEKQQKHDTIGVFLNRLDEFNLNEYIKVIKFDELKVPTVPFQLPSSRTYFGIEEMKESELDFLKATVLSKSMSPVTMYSDMPLKEMAKDADFSKKWMFGMAMMLKKGLHLNQIHNIDRSFDEMMLGLESWIPMYMTGQISPYYLKGIQNSVFHHFLKVSGSAALTGEAIAGYHSDGKYYLTKSRKEIAYYEKRAQELVANAYPLMEIYRSDKENELNAFLLSDSDKPGKRRSILSTLPLYTADCELLKQILKRNKISEERQKNILEYVEAQKLRVIKILETKTLEDEIPIVTKDEFAAHPQVLELSGIFCETDITYSYEEYMSHLTMTEEFAASHSNYKLLKASTPTFRNLQILIHEDQWVMVSKSKAPAIHFVIRHPKLRKAIENFIPPVIDK